MGQIQVTSSSIMVKILPHWMILYLKLYASFQTHDQIPP